jgi:hypothetical protein
MRFREMTRQRHRGEEVFLVGAIRARPHSFEGLLKGENMTGCRANFHCGHAVLWAIALIMRAYGIKLHRQPESRFVPRSTSAPSRSVRAGRPRSISIRSMPMARPVASPTRRSVRLRVASHLYTPIANAILTTAGADLSLTGTASALSSSETASSDGPLPLSVGGLAAGLLGIASRRLRRPAANGPGRSPR